MSALGLLLAPVAVDLAVSRPMPLGAWEPVSMRDVLARLSHEGHTLVTAAGVAAPSVTLSFSVDMRHVGQGHEIPVALPDPLLDAATFADRLRAAFATAYEALYGRGLLAGADIEVITWRARAAGPREPFTATLVQDGPPAPRARRSRRAWFEEAGGFVETPVLSHYALPPGAEVRGPAIVEQRESTVVVGPSASATIDARRNLVMRLA
jgi:N-methylhydantoinase A